MLELAGYRDVEQIGEGGLGRVYRAVRESTGGSVAIKELRDIAEASPAWHRARRELEAMLRLKGHPYVISVEEIVEGPNGPCLVMEYVPGGSLMDRLAHGPLSAPEIVLVGQQVTQALAAAHAVGMVHRDVKPHNLLVGQFGQVKVCDFGIAALARGGMQTQTQALTLAYASPEALDDGPIGPAADVFSFGATMSHLLTGRKPSLQERMSGAAPQLQSADPAMAGVVAVVNACQAFRAEDRPTMAVVAAAFDQAAAQLGPRRLTALGDPGLDDRTVVRTPGIATSEQQTVQRPGGVAYTTAPVATTAVPMATASGPVPPPSHDPATSTNPAWQQYPNDPPPPAVPVVYMAPPRNSSAVAALWGALVAGLVIAVVALVLLTRGRSDQVEAASTTDPPAATDVEPTEAPAETSAITSPVTPAATVEPATTAPTITSAPPTSTTEVPVTVVAATAPPQTFPPVVPTTLPLDLAVSLPMQQPACDGSFVTMLGASVMPDTYPQIVQLVLDEYPGSNYMLTENTCPSLTPRTSDGNLIYSIYFGPFRTLAEACDARRFGPSDAYVRVLDLVTSPTETTSCG